MMSLEETTFGSSNNHPKATVLSFVSAGQKNDGLGGGTIRVQQHVLEGYCDQFGVGHAKL